MKDSKTTLIVAAVLISATMFYWNHHSSKLMDLVQNQNNDQAQNDFEKHIQHNHNHESNTEDLRYAYTGNWEKNNVTALQAPQSNPLPKLKYDPKSANKDVKKKDQKKIAQKKKLPLQYRYYTNQTPSYTLGNHSGTAQYLYNAGSPAPASTTPSPISSNNAKKSAQDYLSQILSSKSISQLVADYKAHRTDAATFYAVMTDLLAPSEIDPTIRILAYQAMGQLGPAAQSFNMIATYKDHETNPNVQKVAQADMTAYANVSYVGTMNSFLAANNSDAVRIAAAQVIQTLAQQVLGVGTTNNHAGAITAQQAAQIFGPVLQNLNQLLNSNHLNSQVAQVFSLTRNTLLQFLG